MEICIDLNKWVGKETIDLKQIKTRLISTLLKPKRINELNIKFNTNANEDFNPFITCQKMTKNVPLRNVQYKILHNADPTMKHLFLWKHKPSPNCSHCNTPESLVHAIWECEIAKQTIENLKNTLMTLKSTQTLQRIEKEDFIFGSKISSTDSMIYTLVKRRLILQREDKAIITNEQLSDMVKQEINVEKYNAIKQKKELVYNARWREYGYLQNQ